MNQESWTVLAVGITLGGLVWQMLRSLRHDMLRRFGDVDRKFDEISDNFRDVRGRLDSLAADHQGLARELSELRGEIRGRLDERARPSPG